MVHGDDFLTLGELGEVEHVKTSHCATKVWAILAAGRDDAKRGTNLELMCVRWNSGEKSGHEPDPQTR